MTDEKRHRRVRTERKAQAVLRVLKGDDAVTVAQDEGVSIERLERWQARFVEGGRAALVHKSSRTGMFKDLGENFKGLGQWAGLLILLVLVVLFLVRFMSHDSGQ